MNPIARLEELRAARKRVSNLHPPDSPDCPNSLTGERADNRENRDNRAAVKAEGGLPTPRQSGQSGESGDYGNGSRVAPTAGPEVRQSGESGESGGCESESPVADRQRWGLPPGEQIPLATLTPTIRPADVDLLTAHMKRQPPEVWQWIEDQAGRYAQRDTRRPRSDAFLAAALDCLLWEWDGIPHIMPPADRASRYDRVQAAVRYLRSLADIARDFEETRTAPAGERKGPPA